MDGAESPQGRMASYVFRVTEESGYIIMVDFAINAERRDGATPLSRNPSSMPAALPADLHDDDGCNANRNTVDAWDRRGLELRQPLGFAVMGGLALSQALTLNTTPVVYLYLDKLQRWLAPRRSRIPALAAKMQAEAD